MGKVWYCPSCGYEVDGRGKCHACGDRLVASPLPELRASGDDEDEVGYRLGDWEDRQRGRLIEALIAEEVLHRFEEDELIVDAADEARVDDLVAEVASFDAELGDAGAGSTGSLGGGGAAAEEPDAAGAAAAVAMLAGAARRLREDPTDMQADAGVAEASAGVFMVEVFYGADPETWAAIGRVTRRLLAALGSDEALEGEIRLQASILDKLLEPLVETGAPLDGDAGGEPGGSEAGGLPDDAGAPDEEEEATEAGSGGSETVYELLEWLPEQRAQLSVLLDAQGIDHGWEDAELVVPAEREADVEAMFDSVEGLPSAEEDDEARYRSLEALFAAADRLANDPDSEQRGADVVAAVLDVEGPTPVGLDDAQWFQILSRARTLADAIEHHGHRDVMFGEAVTLRDMLRALV